MRTYVKLAEAPTYVIQYPLCSACCVDLEYDDGWTCPGCGTSWDRRASDGDEGDLYESWSGETLDGPVVSEDEAFDLSLKREREEREARLRALGIR